MLGSSGAYRARSVQHDNTELQSIINGGATENSVRRERLATEEAGRTSRVSWTSVQLRP